MSGRTRGMLIPFRSHEDHEGPYFEIDADEREYYNSRPFTKLMTREGVTVATAHDLFEFRPGDAERLALCWNALEGMDDDTVRRLGEWLARYNADELRQMLDEEGV